MSSPMQKTEREPERLLVVSINAKGSAGRQPSGEIMLNSQIPASHRSLALGSSRYETALRDDRFDRAHLLQKFVGEHRRVLELGCSTGYISRLLKQCGCRVVGIECDPVAAHSAASVCDQVILADLNGNAWTEHLEERFDVVLMGDVLEHLLHPDEVLRSVRQLLLPGGVIIVSLPNVVYWSQRLKTLFGKFDYQSIGLLDYTHLRFFTLRSAVALIENSGYRIVEFHPIIGGRFCSRFRLLWQGLANLRPSLFGYQLLFRAQPREQDENIPIRPGPAPGCQCDFL
jgi:2-polyprenyl-3-methyl-5-hydroxy-6-metoxy-1,4-benzoquinol methylase